MLLRMKKILFLPFLLLCCCLFSANLSAQSARPWPKTLLWRISGNGLSKQSYLFGSMHLQDKRLFYFGDSLYHYLDQAEGYALEVNLQELMDSVIRKAIDEQTDELLDKKRMNNDKEKKKIVDSLVRNVMERNDKSSRAQLKKLREEKVRKAIKNKEMPTIVDAYLYGIARRKGKWLGGIEDVNDQLSLLNEWGDEITGDQLMAPDAMLTSTLEEMIGMYLAADLEGIDRFSNSVYSDDMEDRLLRNRNGKMARRMDSLAHIRSMFFTVGAAHLPGDSGVISLLRQRGFRVDPVFSSARIDPDQYVVGLAEVPWVKVEDEQQSYEVEMPGSASELEMMGGLITMKYYADMTTLTFYMAGSTIANTTDVSSLVKSMTENTDGRIISQKKIEKDGAQGVEALVVTDEIYYKVHYLLKDNMIYMLIAGSEKKEKIETPDVKKFLASFIPKKKASVASSGSWRVLQLEDKACTIQFPGTPKRMPQLEQKAEGSEWTFRIYQYTDNDIIYMFQVRDLVPGYYLTGDTSYFALARDMYKKFIDKVTTDEHTTIQSFPAFRYEGEAENAGVVFKTLIINRGNRVYTLFTGGVNTPETIAVMDRYLGSLELIPYQPSRWDKELSPDGNFYTIAPAGFEFFVSRSGEEEEDGTSGGDSSYVAYDSNRVVSYQVHRTELSPYYWVAGDSLFFENAGREYKDWSDSVIYKKPVMNGGLKGMEWLIQMPDNHNLKWFRQLLNGDTLYTLFCFLPRQYADEAEHSRFFNGFTVVQENLHPSIYSSKAALLLNDLRSADTAVFEKASAAFSDVTFGKEDQPLLHEALLKEYIDDSTDGYYTIRTRIVNTLRPLADSSTVSFIREQFPRLTGSREKIKFDLLNVLAMHSTAYSYSVMKELLLQYTPTEKGNTELGYYYLIDSLQLTRQLFPEILTLSNDHLFAERIIDLCVALLDSNLIDTEMLDPYRRNFLYVADTTLAGIKDQTGEEEFDGYSYVNIVKLLGYLNDPESNRLLQAWLLPDDLTIKQEAAVALLKNNQPVSGKELEKIAADKAYRKDLYESLGKIGKQDMFPSKYLTQQYMAESDLYRYAYDEVEPKLVFIGKRELVYKGEKQRFYLFKITYSYGEEGEEDEGGKEEYLGIAGPYALNLKKVTSDNKATGWVWKETYDAKKTEQQLADFLKEREQEEGEEE